MKAVIGPPAPTREPAGVEPDHEAAAITGRVHSWDLSTGVDGPGTRVVVFLSGCLMRCLYCANPDTWDRDGGTERTVGEVMRRISRFVPALKVSGGGVTITGG